MAKEWAPSNKNSWKKPRKMLCYLIGMVKIKTDFR